MKNFKILFLLLFILLCNIGTVYAQVPQKEDYRLDYVNINWWKQYNDENLVNLIMTSFVNNQDLKIATIKSKQADQAVKEAFANELPYIGFSGNIGRDITSATTKFGDLIIPDYSQTRFLLPLTMTYEVDIWGANRLKTKSVEKQRDIIKQSERASYINLTSEVASSYFNLIKLDKLIENQEKLVKLQKKIASMQDIKYKNGLCSTIEVLEQKQALTVFEEELNDYKNKHDIIYNQLVTLIGKLDTNAIDRNTFENITLPTTPDNLTASVLAERPDLIRAEDYIKKIGYDVKVARRNFLPRFVIYGNAGFNAYNNFSHLFDSHTFLSNFGILPSFDLFTGGAKLAHLRFNKLEYEKAKETYQKTLLTSLQELNDSLSTAKIAKKNYDSAKERVQIEKEKFSLSEKSLAIGSKSYLDYLKSEEAVILSEKAEISNKINYLISTINLYKAVGGKDYNHITNDNENI